MGIERAPDVVLSEAATAAAALKKVIDGKEHKVMMGGQPYLEFEDWQTLGRFYGTTARADEAEYVEMGNARGFRATAVAIRGGEVISRATAFCLDDEEKWSERATYTWGYVTRDGDWSPTDPGREQIVWEQGRDGKRRPKRERRMTGVEPVPLFQLASMAQTRACAKALRNVLAWVVVLAGYKPTPAEEIDTEPRRAAQPAGESSFAEDDALSVPAEPEAPPFNPEQTALDLPDDPNGRVDDAEDPLWRSWLALRERAAESGLRSPIITLPAARKVLLTATEAMRRQLGIASSPASAPATAETPASAPTTASTSPTTSAPSAASASQ
jgi:hypothetical protein